MDLNINAKPLSLGTIHLFKDKKSVIGKKYQVRSVCKSVVQNMGYQENIG